MSFPDLFRREPGEVLLFCTCDDDDDAVLGPLTGAMGGRRDGDVITLAITGVRLRLVDGWGDKLSGGNVPVLFPPGAAAPISVTSRAGMPCWTSSAEPAGTAGSASTWIQTRSTRRILR